MAGYDDIGRAVGAAYDVAEMTAFGSALGPKGAMGGALVGLVKSAYETYLDRKKKEKQAELDEKNAAEVKRKYKSAREEFGIGRSIYAATKNEDVSSLEQIRQRLVTKQQSAEAGLR